MGHTKGTESMRIVVDGEQFDVTEREQGVYDFIWLTGSGQTTGFSAASSSRERLEPERLEEHARAFLRGFEEQE